MLDSDGYTAQESGTMALSFSNTTTDHSNATTMDDSNASHGGYVFGRTAIAVPADYAGFTFGATAMDDTRTTADSLGGNKTSFGSNVATDSTQVSAKMGESGSSIPASSSASSNPVQGASPFSSSFASDAPTSNPFAHTEPKGGAFGATDATRSGGFTFDFNAVDVPPGGFDVGLASFDTLARNVATVDTPARNVATGAVTPRRAGNKRARYNDDCYDGDSKPTKAMKR